MRRIVIGLVLAIAAGCGASSSTDDMGRDMQTDTQNCPPLNNVGDPCNPACMYEGYPCGCSQSGVVTCLTRDMATHD